MRIFGAPKSFLTEDFLRASPLWAATDIDLGDTLPDRTHHMINEGVDFSVSNLHLRRHLPHRKLSNSERRFPLLQRHASYSHGDTLHHVPHQTRNLLEVLRYVGHDGSLFHQSAPADPRSALAFRESLELLIFGPCAHAPLLFRDRYTQFRSDGR
jgi:hypothetical protein